MKLCLYILIQHVNGEKLNGGLSVDQNLHVARDAGDKDSNMDFNGKQEGAIAEEQKDIDGHVTEDHVPLEVSMTQMQYTLITILSCKKVCHLI